MWKFIRLIPYLTGSDWIHWICFNCHDEFDVSLKSRLILMNGQKACLSTMDLSNP